MRVVYTIPTQRRVAKRYVHYVLHAKEVFTTHLT